MSRERFLPYGRQDIAQSDIDAVVEVLRSDYLTTGPHVARFEEELAQRVGARYAVAVANGTAALHLAVLALDLPEGAAGITHPNTFVATSNALVYARLEPLFADIRADTYVMDPAALSKALKQHAVSVVLPVHFAGHTADVEEVARLARDHGAAVIEDAAHSIGGTYGEGALVGSCRYSDMTIFSFHPVKTMTTGEGGAITTNDRALYDKLVMLRTHGITKDPARFSHNPGPWYYEMQMLGFNYRMTDLQAALGSSQLARLDHFVDRRRALVERYNAAFAGLSWLSVPYEAPGRRTAWHLYVPRFDWSRLGVSRPEAMDRLRGNGVGTQVLYIPVHLQPFYRDHFGFQRGDFPVAESYYEQALALPLFPGMTDTEQDRVIAAVRELGA